MAEARFLITIGSPECPRMGLNPLTRVGSDVKRIAELFTAPTQGYTHVLEEAIPLGATAATIRKQLSAWFADPKRTSEDCVVVYIAGHGDEAGRLGHHYLFTSDSAETELTETAIKTSSLAELFFEGTGDRSENVLLLLDLCYAGKGGGQATAAVSLAKSKTLISGGSGLWVVAAADARTEAGDGDFVKALEAVLEDDAWVPPGGMEYLNPHHLKDAVNSWFEGRLLSQRAEIDVAGSAGRDRFIRNPGFTKARDGRPLADEAHWDPKARGVEATGVPGWFFTGRTRALRELIAWMSHKSGDGLARVVTGLPGSGKSTVLAWLVIASRGEARKELALAGLDAGPAPLPGIGTIDAAVHARGLTLLQVAISLGTQLGISVNNPADLFTGLKERTGPVRIIVDALDESAEPRLVETELLQRLTVIPKVRLILGTRRSHTRVPLGGLAKVIDLDTEEYYDQDDLVEYVLRRLLKLNPTGVYAGRHVDAKRVATLVAGKAGFSFLYARLVSRSLAFADRAIDTTVPGWESRLVLPANLPEAFGADLHRHDDETRRRLVDLMVPLAYARGKGLPQKLIWHTIASAVSKGVYTNVDIRELKQKAGYYIVQDTEQGEVVYRLFHDTFAQYLRDQTCDEEVEATITRALLSLTPRGATGEIDWLAVHEPYILSKIPFHSQEAGLLDDLLLQPGFLLSAHNDALLATFSQPKSPRQRAFGRFYRKTVHHLRSGEPSDQAAYVQLAAMQYGVEEARLALSVGAGRDRWRPLWASWAASAPSELIATAEGPVKALAVVRDPEGAPLLLSAAGKTLEVWDMDLTTSVRRFPPSSADIASIATIATNDTIWVATKDNEGTIRVFDLDGGKLLGEQIRAHGERTTTYWTAGPLCAMLVDDRPLLASGGGDRMIRLWSLPDLQVVAECHPTDAILKHLATTTLQGVPILVSGSDSFGSGESIEDRRDTEDKLVRIWRLPDLEFVQEVPHTFTDSVDAILPIPTEEGPRLLIEYAPRSNVEVWDPVAKRSLGGGSAGFVPLGWVSKPKGPIVYGQKYGMFRSGRLVGSHLEVSPRELPVIGSIWTPPIEVRGRMMIASAADADLHIWDLEELIEESWMDVSLERGDIGFPTALFLWPGTPSLLITGTSAGYLEGRDSETGEVIWSKRISPNWIVQLEMTELGGQRVLVISDKSGSLQFVAPSTGDVAADPLAVGGEILSFALRVEGARTTCFLAGMLPEAVMRHTYAVRAWDLTHRTELDTSDPIYGRIYLMSGWQDKPLFCVGVLQQPERLLLVAAGPVAWVRAWDVGTRRTVQHVRLQGRGNVVRLAVGRLNGRDVAVCGYDEGGLEVMALNDGSVVCSAATAHIGQLTTVQIIRSDGRDAILTSGWDGRVCIWEPSLEPCFEIDMGEVVWAATVTDRSRIAIASKHGLSAVEMLEPEVERVRTH